MSQICQAGGGVCVVTETNEGGPDTGEEAGLRADTAPSRFLSAGVVSKATSA